MWKIEKPTIGALETFDACIEPVRKGDLKDRLNAIRLEIDAGQATFEQAATTSSLFRIEASNHVGSVTAKEMEKLYDRHMARNGSRGRATYDKIMIGAAHDICPFCGHRTVSTLDHTLPKAEHPLFAVTPINLVPCCKDCNHAKGTHVANIGYEQFFNPYYDDVTNVRWLFAEIVQEAPPGARFFVAPADVLDDDHIRRRVNHHFRELKLARLYASQAGRQLQNMRGALREIFEGNGANAVKSDLLRRARGCAAVSLNSWEGALYEAAAENEWYCEGGFQADGQPDGGD